jgi:uncharacterized repeat protein (TIGR01451 family)
MKTHTPEKQARNMQTTPNLDSRNGHRPQHLVPLFIALLFTGILLTVGMWAAPARAEHTPPSVATPVGTITLPENARNLPPELGLSAADAGAHKNAKMDSVLSELATALSVQASQTTVSLTDLAAAKGVRLDGTRGHVQLVIDPGQREQVEQAITSVGGEITGTSYDGTVLQGWLPLSSLLDIANRPDVHYIRRPVPVELLETDIGSFTTEAIDDFKGLVWQQAGITGQGVKIGIIDGGFQGYTQLLGSDLPAQVTIKNFVDGETDAQVDGTTIHGAACAEVIHDIAPDAQLYLAKVSSNIDLQEAVTWMKDVAKVDVISTSIGWYNLTPGDGTGEFNDVAAQARAAGIFWVSAAGNDRRNHWGGLFSDPDNDGFLNFTASNEVNFFGPGDGTTAYLIPAGQIVSLYIRWSDWSSVNQDYDLYLVRWSGTEWQTVAQSENTQNGGIGQTPTESIVATTSGSAAPYGIVVYKYNANLPTNFELFAPKFFRPDQILTSRSLANLADAPNLMTVAAVDVNNPYPQEPYSAEGPTNGPGGAASGGFTKPDIAGFANVSTASYGSKFKFDGTSAATPHVAGAAALVLSAYPQYTPEQVQDFLETRAIDMGSSGFDPQTGHGRLDLGAPPASLSRSTMSLEPTVAGPGDVVTYTLEIVNQGGLTTTATLTNPLPAELLVTTQPQAIGADRPLTPTNEITWTGTISPTSSVTIIYTATLTTTNPSAPLRVINFAELSDADGHIYWLTASLNPVRIFLPFVRREE